MQFIWIDADYWTVLFVKLTNVKRVLSIVGKYIVVEFVPIGQGREFGPREVRNGTQV
jgi:hypothetical protein